MKGTPEMPACGFSKATIQVLGLQGVDPNKFTAFNVLEDDALRAGMFSYYTGRIYFSDLLGEFDYDSRPFERQG